MTFLPVCGAGLQPGLALSSGAGQSRDSRWVERESQLGLKLHQAASPGPPAREEAGLLPPHTWGHIHFLIVPRRDTGLQEQVLQPCWQSKGREQGCYVLILKAMNFRRNHLIGY